MKFINLGDKHSEYDFYENIRQNHDEGKPRRIPSYIDTAKKHKASQKSNQH